MLHSMYLMATILVTADIKPIVPVAATKDSSKMNDISAELPSNELQTLPNIKKDTEKTNIEKEADKKHCFKNIIVSKEKTEKDTVLFDKKKCSREENNDNRRGTKNNKSKKNTLSTYTTQSIEQQKTDVQKNVITEKDSLLIDTSSKTPQKVTIVNSVTPEKTTYTHWSGTYQPEFSIKVDGNKINMCSQETIEIHKKKITVSYHAQFPANHSSQDEWVVDVEQDTQTITLDFDWNTKPRLQINQASSILK